MLCRVSFVWAFGVNQQQIIMTVHSFPLTNVRRGTLPQKIIMSKSSYALTGQHIFGSPATAIFGALLVGVPGTSIFFTLPLLLRLLLLLLLLLTEYGHCIHNSRRDRHPVSLCGVHAKFAKATR